MSESHEEIFGREDTMYPKTSKNQRLELITKTTYQQLACPWAILQRSTLVDDLQCKSAERELGLQAL